MNAFCIYEQLHEAFQEARIAQVPVVLDIKVDKNDAPLPGKIIFQEAKGYAAFSEYNADQKKRSGHFIRSERFLLLIIIFLLQRGRQIHCATRQQLYQRMYRSQVNDSA